MRHVGPSGLIRLFRRTYLRPDGRSDYLPGLRAFENLRTVTALSLPRRLLLRLHKHVPDVERALTSNASPSLNLVRGLLLKEQI